MITIYHYTYVVIDIFNRMFYTGLHSTDNLNDGYPGSGTELKKARAAFKKEFGAAAEKTNFIKFNLTYHKSAEEMKAQEKFMVNVPFIASKLTYNLQIGGGGSNGPPSDETKALMRAAGMGNTRRRGKSQPADFGPKKSDEMMGNTYAEVLTDDEVRAIFTSPKMCRELAKEFGTSESHVSRIKHGVCRSRATSGCQPSPKRGLTDEQIMDIYNSTGFRRVMAEKYGISRTLVSHIKSGKLHSRVTGRVWVSAVKRGEERQCATKHLRRGAIAI